MLKLAWLGTGIMRLVNIGLIIAVAIGLAVAGYKLFTGHYIDIGRGQVTNEIHAQNEALDNKVDAVNTEVIHDVTHETQLIEHNSKDIEYVIRNMPTEQISNVSDARLNSVYEQQRSVREASQGSK